MKSKTSIAKWELPWVKVIRIFFSIIFLVVLGFQLKDRVSILRLDDFTNLLSIRTLVYLSLALFLMPLNWFLEAKKWKLLMGTVSTRFSFQSVVVGITAGLFTINRVGELVGRSVLLTKRESLRGMNATVVGGLVQLMVTFVIGILAFWYIQNETGMLPNFIVLSYSGIVIFTLLILGLLLSRSNHLTELLFRFPFIKNRFAFRSITFENFDRVVIYSILRYLVYTAQCILLYYFVGVDSSLFICISVAACIFLIQSTIPLPSFLGVAFRIELTLLIWSYFGFNEGVLAISAVMLWIINLVLPALIGLHYINKLNIFGINDNN